ncbi:unnamed protein product, partial [Prorocentrum cordatum]
ADAVLERYVQRFASEPWDSLAGAPAGPGPASGGREADTPAARRGLIAAASGLLREVFAGCEAAAERDFLLGVLQEGFLNRTMGMFELVNMCVTVAHPLALCGERLCELLGREALARVAELQRAAEEDSDSDSGGSSEAKRGAPSRAAPRGRRPETPRRRPRAPARSSPQCWAAPCASPWPSRTTPAVGGGSTARAQCLCTLLAGSSDRRWASRGRRLRRRPWRAPRARGRRAGAPMQEIRAGFREALCLCSPSLLCACRTARSTSPPPAGPPLPRARSTRADPASG